MTAVRTKIFHQKYHTIEETMSYKYDVFFSYKRDRRSAAWHEGVKDRLQYYCSLKLDHDPIMFFDTNDIFTGDTWRETLGEALRLSKVIVCMWSPSYFQSKWCVSEWKTFVKRGELFGKRLVMPATIYDGEEFPKDAKETQIADFKEFHSIEHAFWHTPSAAEFRDILMPFAETLATRIWNAPDFDSSFPLIEVSDDQVIVERPIRRLGDV
jgi:TIR domain